MAFGITRDSGRSSAVNFANLGLRVAQFIIGVVVLGIYAAQLHFNEWRLWNNIENKFALGVAAGAISMITAPVLAGIPFFLGYRVVAFAFVWDFIVMVLYAATFAYFKQNFHVTDAPNAVQDALANYGIPKSRTQLIQNSVWIDLVGMLLWLISFLMAIVLLILSKFRGSKAEF